MTALWISLAVLTVIAALIVLLPLLKFGRQQAEPVRQRQNIDIFRDRLAELEQEKASGTLADSEFERLKLELERNLLNDSADDTRPLQQSGSRWGRRVLVAVMVLLIPAIALPTYDYLGRADDLAKVLNPPQLPPKVAKAIEKIKASLKDDPKNLEGWLLLGGVSMRIGHYDEALDAYRHMEQLVSKGSAQYTAVQGLLAQAMFYADNLQMSSRVQAQIDKTLKLDPHDVTSLRLLGIDAYNHDNYKGAIEYWSKAWENDRGDTRNSLKQGILQARDQLRAEGGKLPPLPAGITAGTIKLKVSLSEDLKAKVKPEQTVFVFAREPGGSMPIAAARYQAAELPLTVTLDDGMALRPGQELSQYDLVEVGARISVTGSANSVSGDLVADVAKVKVGDPDNTVKLVIDRVVE